jgi:hypothetical protein
MELLLKKIICLILLVVTTISYAQNKVSDYQRVFFPVHTQEGNLMVAIRVLKFNDVPSLLIVNPNTLETKVEAIANLQALRVNKNKPGYFSYWGLLKTRYYQLLNKSTAAPYILENQGITHAANNNTGVILSIDLCPSSKPFEAEFFHKLLEISERSVKPLPLTLSISGLWLLGHPHEFAWILAKEKEHKFAITWANHSFSHVFYSDLPYSENFLLTKESNLDLEFLLTEQYLLEAGEVPSVFFRFPGLVSNKKLIQEIKKYGLIPLGADAWIAKNQAITPGTIILVHGNGNEPEGINILLPQLNAWSYIDIKEAI